MKRKNTIPVLIHSVLIILVLIFDAGLFWYTRPVQRIGRLVDAGQKYLLDNDYKDALVLFRKAILIDKKSVPAQLGVGKSAFLIAKDTSDLSTKEKYFDEARDAYSTVMSIERDNEEALSAMDDLYVEWSNVYIDAGDYDKAQQLLSEAEDVSSSESNDVKSQISKVETLVAEEKKKEEENKQRAQAYADTITKTLDDYFSNGTYDYVKDMSSMKTAQQFAVMDVDGDGHDELIIAINDASVVSMAGMIGWIFDYDLATNQVREEMSEFPYITIYENGTIEEAYSHNQGIIVGSMGAYTLYRYNSTKDVYEAIYDANSWSKEFLPDDNDEIHFPDEIDQDGDGEIYIITTLENNQESDVDNAQYFQWHNQQVNNTNPVHINYYYCTPENIESLRNQTLGQPLANTEPAPYLDALKSVAVNSNLFNNGINLDLSSGQCFDQGDYYEVKNVKLTVPTIYSSREDAVAAAGSNSSDYVAQINEHQWKALRQDYTPYETTLYQGSIFVRKDAQIGCGIYENLINAHYVLNVDDFQNIIRDQSHYDGNCYIQSFDANGYITSLDAKYQY